MLAEVVDAYTDKYTREIHRTGETVELTDERAKELAASGHVLLVEQAEAPQKKAAPRRRTAKKQ